MLKHDPDLLTRIRELEDVVVQQASGIALLSQQLHAVLLVNTALVASLRDRDLLDVDQMQTKVLEVLPEGPERSNVVMHIDALLAKPVPAVPPAYAEAMDEQRRGRARTRFTVFKGGGQGTEGPES